MPAKRIFPSKINAKTTMAARKSYFLEGLRRTANVSQAAREAGLPTSTVYRHRTLYPQFRASWDAAAAEAVDELEAIVIDRVRHGVEKPIFYGGEERGTMRVYSDALAMFILRAKRPEVYGQAQGAASAAGTSGEMTEPDAEREIDRRLTKLAAPVRAQG